MAVDSDAGALEPRLQEVDLRCASLLESSNAVRWEVFAKASVTRQTEVRQGRLKRSVQIEESGIGVRSWDGNRTGFAAASALDASAARTAVETARAGARAGADPMPPARLLGTVPVAPGPDMPPRGWAQHIAGELGLALAGLSGSVLRLERVVVQEGRYHWTLSTGDGWSADHGRMVASLLLEVLVGDRPGIWREWVHISDPGSFDAEAVASRLGNRILLTRNRVATDSGLHDLILHPEVTAQLLAAVSPLFLAADDARDPLPRLLDSSGFLASFPLTLVDDRSDPGAPVVSPCDGEGFPANRTLLLEEGAPRHRVASWADAHRFDEIPRGGAVRLSYRDRPATGLTNLRVATRDGVPPGELLAASRRALYVLRPLAPVVCDFERDTYSLIASGVWLRRQQVRGWHPVVELSGSLGTLLRRIAVVGEDLCWFQTAHGFVGAPSLLIRRQPVVG